MAVTGIPRIHESHSQSHDLLLQYQTHLAGCDLEATMWCVRVCVCVCGCLLSPVQLFVDCSPPGFSVYRILQARILKWVAISSSRES